MITLDDITYDLPPELIAQAPAQPRDSARLLCLNRATGNIQHSYFHTLVDFLRPGDVLVRNRSRVIPARLFGKKNSGGRAEVLLLRCINSPNNEWECLCKPGLKPNQSLTFPTGISGEIISHVRSNFNHTIRFNCSYEHFLLTLENIGETPLPPYIHADPTDPNIRDHYQTTYAREAGSAAAPTAGLHFTKALDFQLLHTGISITEVVLHVGLGTFAPVRTHEVTNHIMHSEQFILPQDTISLLRQAKAEKRRIIAVGTTTVRVLESCAEQILGKQTNSNPQDLTGDTDINPQDLTGDTDIFMYPPYNFKLVDGLITNFHLPKSTLLLLVSAFTCYPNTPHHFTHFKDTPVGKAYAEAIANNYRFFSFGDGMLIL